jgi:3'(2'), 5'-bisphosphate nucleotidase
MTDTICTLRIGEEDSADLRSPATEGLRKHLTTLANDALHLPLRSGSQYGDAEEDAGWGIGPESPVRSTEELLKLIDRGTHEGGPTGRESSNMYIPSSMLQV